MGTALGKYVKNKMDKIDKKIMYLTRLGYAASLIIIGLAFRFISKSYLILGNVIACIGGVVIIYCILKALEGKFPKTVKLINKVLTYCIVIFCFAFATTEGAIIYGYETGDEEADNAGLEEIEADYLVVLGAGVENTKPSELLRFRLETALEYLKLHPETICIVSGGMTTSTEMSEAECMRRWLVQNGISATHIMKEETAQDTYQNIKFSYAIVNTSENKNAKVAVVTGDYHVLRAKLMAKLQGYEPIMIGAETESILVKVNYYMREVFALWNRMIFGYKTA